MRLARILTLWMIICANFTFAQEELIDLQVISTKSGFIRNQEPSQGGDRINILQHPFIYVIDTLSLPFFDDFSTNRIKEYDANLDDPNVSLKINYDFRVNGATPDVLTYQKDTTYSVLRQMNGNLVFSANPTLFIQLYEDGKEIGRDTGWTNIITEFNQANGEVTFDTLLAERTLVNNPDTFYRVADDNTLWTPPTDTFDSVHAPPFINNRFAKNMLTQGVATFDGTDANGNPYDITSATSYGLADMLTSKPLALDSNMFNVYLSFFYQAGGYGNYPEESDSLVVEFFDVVDSTWRFAKKIIPPTTPDTLFTDQIFIPISGRRYLQNGFRFRFKNYATLSGGFDQWHIDYVRVDKDRDTIADDSVIADVAFTKGISSFLSSYKSVPYSHYLSDPAAFETDRVAFTYVNLGLDTVILTGLRYEIFDPNGSLVGGEVTADPRINARTRLTTIFPVSESPVYPDLGSPFADFNIRLYYTSTGQANTYTINDTIYETQQLRDFYAYDDGTAEQAYGLTGAGLELAYEFQTPIGDTLRAVYINFPQWLHDDNEDLTIKLLVWNDLNQPPIYETELWVEPKYTDGNEFYRLNLLNPVYVKDKFYVGFRQQENTKIYVGFDVNSNASDKISYRIGEQWFGSGFKGALLIRPSFSKEELLGTESAGPTIPIWQPYPNPAHDVISWSNDFKASVYQLFDLTGQLIISSHEHNHINVANVPNGLYILQCVDNLGRLHTAKCMVTH